MVELNTDTCDLSGVNIVEAGAGTGKTYSIQKLVLRLILEKEIPLPKLLVVTFTKAATGELLHRLHAILQLSADALDDLEAGKDIFGDARYTQIHTILNNMGLDCAAARRARCRALVQDALRDYDQAAVMTIHGFCERVLQTNAFLSFVRYGVEVRPDISDVQARIAMDFCRKTMYTDDAPLAVTTSSGEHGNLLEQTKPAIDNAHNGAQIIWPNFQDDDDLLAILADPKLWAQEACPLYAKVTLIQAGRKFLSDYDATSFGELAGRISTAIADGDMAFVWSVCQGLQKEKMRGYVGRGSQATLDDACYDGFFESMVAVSAYVSRRFFEFYQEQLEACKAREGFMTYDDLIRKMHEVVTSNEGEELRRTLREMFSYVFVDEFQDTDSCQYEIFRRVFIDGAQDGGNRGFFMIGDPKQAIYSFRGGDVHAYLNAATQVPETHRYSLSTNYRSGQHYIGALNGLYGSWDNPFEVQGIQMATIQHGSEADNLYCGNGIDKKPLQFIPCPNKDTVNDWTVNKVLDLLSDQRYSIGHGTDGRRPVTASDIAILVPTKAQGGELEESLNRKGVDTMWLSESDIFTKPEAKMLRRFLDMLYGGASLADMAAVLADGLFMCSATELARFQKEPPEGVAAEDVPCVQAQRYFGELRKTWETKGVHAMLRKLLHEPNAGNRQWLCAIRDVPTNGLIDHFMDESSLAVHIIQSDKVNGRYIFGRIRQLADKLHRAEQRRHLTPGRLLAYLQGMINKDKDLEDSGMEHNVQRSTDRPAVRLLTLHHSKGLEFPIVLLPCVISHKNIHAANRLFHDSMGQRCVDMAGGHAPECAAEFRQEKLRLLYVGLTRAKFACYAPYSTHGSNYQEVADKLKSLPNFEDYKVLPNADLSPDYHGEQPDDIPAQARSFEGQAVWDWQVGSFSGFKGAFHNEDVPEAAPAEPEAGGDDERDEEEEVVPAPAKAPAVLPGDEAQEAIFSFAAGKEAGTIWHELFETMDFQLDGVGVGCFDPESDLALLARLPSQSLYQAIRRHRDEDDEARRRDVAFARMLKGILCNPMGEAGRTFRLKDIPRERRASELRFLYVLKADATLRDVKDCLERHGIPTGDWAVDAETSRKDWALTGSIDLLCQAADGRYAVIDWKTNGLNRSMSAFTRDGMEREINRKLYSLQYLLYTVAFWHFLKERQGVELTAESYQRHFGGVLYLFVRGMAAPLEEMSSAERTVCQGRGIYFVRPPFELIRDLKELLDIRPKA